MANNHENMRFYVISSSKFHQMQQNENHKEHKSLGDNCKLELTNIDIFINNNIYKCK